MLRVIVRCIREPGRYLPLAIKIAQQPLCYLFQHRAFFLQGQMDMHPCSRWHSRNFAAATGGYLLPGDGESREVGELEPWDTTRRDMLVLLLRTILEKKVEGDFAEVGVYKGSTAKLFHHYAPEKVLHLFDTFEGFTAKGAQAELHETGLSVAHSTFSDTSLDEVRLRIAPCNENVRFYKGLFPQSIPEGFGAQRFAFVHLDADLYEPIIKGLEFFYPLMEKNGMIVVHDYNAWPGARRAVDEFFRDKPELPVPMPDKSGSALIVKQ